MTALSLVVKSEQTGPMVGRSVSTETVREQRIPSYRKTGLDDTPMAPSSVYGKASCKTSSGDSLLHFVQDLALPIPAHDTEASGRIPSSAIPEVNGPCELANAEVLTTRNNRRRSFDEAFEPTPLDDFYVRNPACQALALATVPEYCPRDLAMEFDDAPELPSDVDDLGTIFLGDLPKESSTVCAKASRKNNSGDSLLHFIQNLLGPGAGDTKSSGGIPGSVTVQKWGQAELANEEALTRSFEENFEPTQFDECFFRKPTASIATTVPAGVQSEDLPSSSSSDESTDDSDDSTDASNDSSAWDDIAAEEDKEHDEQSRVLIKLQQAMNQSSFTMSSLQEWDKANGLPKSHCQTMVNSSRSREQLQSGLVLQKWDGRPLLHIPGAKVKVTRRMFRGTKVAGFGDDNTDCI
jgi:hypothetical protein